MTGQYEIRIELVNAIQQNRPRTDQDSDVHIASGLESRAMKSSVVTLPSGRRGKTCKLAEIVDLRFHDLRHIFPLTTALNQVFADVDPLDLKLLPWFDAVLLADRRW